MVAALRPEEVEAFRPLTPVGYEATVAAYQQAVAQVSVGDLTNHYTSGLAFFYDTFVPQLKQRLTALTGGVWRLEDFAAYAAGSDVDLMTHLVEAVAARERVCLYPGDWFGFKVGVTQTANVVWDANSKDSLACLCVPSVRNGHCTEEMIEFLEQASSCLLNINLLPTLEPQERQAVAERLSGVLAKSVISVSFSRGFGMTASQLGVFLVHRDHAFRRKFNEQWKWFTYFYNALAARSFLAVDFQRVQLVDQQRRQWVHEWLQRRNLPLVASGSYYVKAFRIEGTVPAHLQPLVRDQVLRLCFKPPQV